MAITVRGIRLEDISLSRNAEENEHKIASATYSLISSADKVLAKQCIGGYGGMVLEPSPATVQALRAFISSYQSDVTTTLGLEE